MSHAATGRPAGNRHSGSPHGKDSDTAAIDVAKLRKRDRGKMLLDDVSFRVGKGEIFGIMGAPGSGKSVIIECVAGVTKPDHGTISVLGMNPRRNRVDVKRKIGVALQSSMPQYDLKVAEALELFASFYPDPAPWETLIADLGLEEVRSTICSRLTTEQRQRFAFALALVSEPEVVLLDEPTAGMDPRPRAGMWELIEQTRERGKTVVLVTRITEEAERLCDRIAVMSAGRIAAVDSPAGLLSRAPIKQRLRFQPSVPFDDLLLTSLPEVIGISRTSTHVTVSGTHDVLLAVTSALAQNRVSANDLRIEDAGLDDAFFALTREGLD